MYISDEGAVNLGEAVLSKAKEDYKTTLRRMSIGKDDIETMKMYRELRRFFNSQWLRTLLCLPEGADISWVLKKLDKEIKGE